MNYYQPILASKQVEALPRQFFWYKLNFIWPLQKRATKMQRGLKLFGLTCSLLCYVGTFIAEVAFIYEHFDSVPLISECLSSLLMGIQFFIRIILHSLREQQLRNLLEHFYKDIYFTSADDSTLLRRICKHMRRISFVTNLCLMPMLLKYISMVIAIGTHSLDWPSKPFVFRFSFPWYDEQAPLAYFLTTIYTAWYPLSFLTLMLADDYLLCMILLHTSYRYKELHLKLKRLFQEASEKAGNMEDNSCNVYVMFRQSLNEVIENQQRLDRFVNVAKSHFSFHVFYSISFGVLMLCLGCFRLQMQSKINSSWLRFSLFVISQSIQFLLIGYFGQMLLNATRAMHESFYMCEWELILPFGDISSNKELMQDIKFAISHAEHGSVFTGKEMFPLTLTTSLLALRSAVSYFMFLRTVSDPIKNK